MSDRRDLGCLRCAALVCLIALTACRPHDFPQYDANYREYAYVTNGGSGTVSVYDVVNVRVDREIPVGQNPTAVAANPARNEVYVVNSGAPNSAGLRRRHQCREQLRCGHHPGSQAAGRHRARSRWRSGLRRQLRIEQHLGARSEEHAAKSRRSASAKIQRLRASRPTARRLSSPIAAATPSASSTPPRARFALLLKAAPAPAMSSSCPIRRRRSQPAPADTR